MGLLSWRQLCVAFRSGVAAAPSVAEPRHVSHRQKQPVWQFYRMSAITRRLTTLSIAWLMGCLTVTDVSVAAAAEPVVAPDFALKAVDGYNYRLSEYRGEVVAVVFWASWCGRCRRELERLQRLQGIYGDAGLQVLGVTVDAKADSARSVAAAVGATFPQLLDSSGSVAKAYRLESLPMIMLVGRAGALHTTYGELDPQGERELIGQLRMLLDE
jgi:peroxiredoxin